jgi:Tol biopolymer transport system component
MRLQGHDDKGHHSLDLERELEHALADAGQHRPHPADQLSETGQLSAWPPDGTQIAFIRGHVDKPENSDVFAMNADGSHQRRLTHTPGFNGFPSWAPDGTKIAFTSDRDGNPEIYTMNADGSGQRV